MTFKYSSLLILTGISINHCGSKTTNQDTTTTIPTTPTTPTASDLTTNSETSSALVASQMDNATTAISSGETGGTGATLISLVDGAENRTCTANTDNTATVAITYSGNTSKIVGKATVTTTQTGTENRIWSKTDGTAVTCNTNQRAKINWASSAFTGAKLAITTDRINNISKVYTTPKGITVTIARNNEVSGTKTVTWKDLSNKSFVSSSTTKLSITDSKGKVSVLDSSNEVRAANPMVITVTRDSTTGKPNTQTIVSGINYSKKTGTFSTTSEFANIVYDHTTSDPCTPVSGTITMKIYSDDSFITLAQTNVLTYTAGVASVTTDGTSNTDFATYIANHTNHNCDIARGN